MPVSTPHIQNNLIIWHIAMCGIIILTIFIGGLTRLTDSGLSITEWEPITGIIPPLTDSKWQEEFAKYQTTPEYKYYNFTMNITEFKFIYRLEFIHRIAGRIVFLLYFVPLIFFWRKGVLQEKNNYLLILFLLMAQGIVGWYMVKSGLRNNPHVSHYRLAVHLMLAVFTYSILFWQLLKCKIQKLILTDSTVKAKVNKIFVSKTFVNKISVLFIIALGLVFTQIFMGGLVAGLDAGLIYNSFPDMGENGVYIPVEIETNPAEIGNFNNPVTVQFLHRLIALILTFWIFLTVIYSLKLNNARLTKIIGQILLTLLIQVSSGIFTLLYSVPVSLGLIHQLGAVILLTCLLQAFFWVKTSD